VLLPLLLDGDTRAIDAAGRGRTTVYWLMTDGRELGNHVGYVWLELRFTGSDGDDRFLTLGAELKAATSSHTSSSWFFIADAHRVGVDLNLGPDVSVEKLRELIGSDAVSTAAEHRRRVGARLFGLTDQTRYGNLVRLLRTLRDPNTGNKIEAGELARVLSDALPPPSEAALEMAAERFDALDQIREQLARVQKTSVALGRFLETYRGYAATVLRGRATAVIDADDQHRKRKRDSKRTDDDAAEAERALTAARGALQRLRDLEGAAKLELDQLRESEAYKHHLNLVERRATVEEVATTAAHAERSARQMAGIAAKADNEARVARAEADQVVKAVSAGRSGLITLTVAAGLDPAVIPADSPDTIPVAAAVAAGRRRAADQVLALARAATAARRSADQCPRP
jgi:hypothetical protein